MIAILLKGILFGLLLAVMIGPVFFALIQNSITKGFRAGLFMALGVVITDILFIFLMYFSVRFFKDNNYLAIGFGIVGGLIMLITGIYSLKKKEYNVNQKAENGRKGAFKQFVKGFVLNGINPFVLLYWLGVMTLVTVNYQYSRSQIIVFFCAIIGTLILTDFTKVALAQKLRSFFTERRLTIMNRVVGVALVIFSLRLFYFAYEHFQTNMIQ